MTVLELTMVLAILIATTGILIYNISPQSLQFGGAGGGQTASHVVTMATMKNLQEAIVGDGVRAGYWDDMGHVPILFPALTKFRFLSKLPEPDFLPSGYDVFNPATKLGWRGPYMQISGAMFPIVNENKGYFSGPHESRYLVPPGTNSYAAVLDGWGNPMVIQGPFPDDDWTVDQVKLTRIVSAGPDGYLDTPTDVSTYSVGAYNDDIVYYIFKKRE